MSLLLVPLLRIPEVREGDDLAALLLAALEPHGGLVDGDVLVVSSKVVSKASALRAPEGSDREALVLEQSARVVAERTTNGAVPVTRIVEALAGPVMTAAGIDASNTGLDGRLLLLPHDPDGAARALHSSLADRVHGEPGAAPPRFAVVLSDTAGRPWRAGQTDFALGSYGLRVLDDLRGGTDADGRALAVTARAVADEIAAAADLVKGKADQVPAALVRGGTVAGLLDKSAPGARSLVRTGPSDWFALGHREAVRAALGILPGTAAAHAVGIPSVGAESPDERGARAVRVALHGHEGAEVTGDPQQGYAVRSADPVLAGRVAARLGVALFGEDLDQVVVSVDDGRGLNES